MLKKWFSLVMCNNVIDFSFQVLKRDKKDMDVLGGSHKKT